MAASDSLTNITIKSAGVLVLGFRFSMRFRFWSKTSTKRCTNIILSRDNTISSLLELIYHVLSISEYIWKNIICFWFWWKIYEKRCTNNYVICVKSLHLRLVDQVLSISGYDLGNGRMSSKQKYWIKNMAVKITVEILLCFCLLC